MGCPSKNYHEVAALAYSTFQGLRNFSSPKIFLDL